MELPQHYMHIKNMLNLTLFGSTNKDDEFITSEKIAIHPNYVKYHKEFKEQDILVDNDYLRECIKFYLEGLNISEKKEIVKIVEENPLLVFALTILQQYRKTKNSASVKSIEADFETYLQKSEVPNSLILFFQQHFLNFDHIDLGKYKNNEIDRDEYFMLLRDYLQPQTRVF